MSHRTTYKSRLGIVVAVLACACAIVAPTAAARNGYALASGFGAAPATITVIDSATNTVFGAPLTFAALPLDMTIGADGKTAYILDSDPKTLLDRVLSMDTGTNQPVGTPIPLGKSTAETLALAPDGARLYVVNFATNDVTVIDTQTNQVLKPTIPVGKGPVNIAISPDGKRAYVTNRDEKSVSLIDTQANQVVKTVTVKERPEGVAISPDGQRLYVANSGSSSVSVIDTETNQEIAGSPIAVEESPESVAVAPNGRFAYVSNFNADTVSVIDTQANQAVGTIPVGEEPTGIAITPDSRTAYVANLVNENLSVIDAAAGVPLGKPVPTGVLPTTVSIVPDQPPVAAFASPARIRPGVEAVFDAGPSRDPDGTVANYAWSFGDGGQAADGGPAPRHTFSRPGRFQVTVTETDNEGCSTAFVFTGKTASCNGSGVAAATRTVEVAYPGVRVRCPARAGAKGCLFKLRGVTRRKRGKAETARARVKLRAGTSAIAPLKPTARFARRLATAGTVLVDETARIGGSTRTSLARLKIVS